MTGVLRASIIVATAAKVQIQMMSVIVVDDWRRARDADGGTIWMLAMRCVRKI